MNKEKSKNIYAFSHIRYRELNEIFHNISFPYAVIKGEPLSFYMYGEFGRRNSADIDILISRKNLKNMEELLAENNFSTKKLNRHDQIMSRCFSHSSLPYKKRIVIGTLEIDLNYDLFWGEYTGERINIDEFLEDTVQMEIWECKIQTLSLIKTFIQLSLHHYREINQIFLIYKNGFINFDKLKDINTLLQNNIQKLPADSLLSICENYKIVPYVYYILYYTYMVTHNEILTNYIDTFDTYEGRKLINCYGLNSKERKEWKIDIYERMKSHDLSRIIETDLTEKDFQKMNDIRRIIF